MKLSFVQAVTVLREAMHVVDSGHLLYEGWSTILHKRIYDDLLKHLCQGDLDVWPGGGGHTRQATVECHHEKPFDPSFCALCCVVTLPLSDESWKQVKCFFSVLYICLKIF